MKQKVSFNIKKAKEGLPIVTKKEYKVKIYDYDCGDKEFPIMGVIIIYEGYIKPCKWKLNGTAASSATSESEEQREGNDIFIIEDVEETDQKRKMTYKELSYWLSPIHGHFRQYTDDIGDVVCCASYDIECADTEVSDDILVREDFGEWMKPTAKLLDKTK